MSAGGASGSVRRRGRWLLRCLLALVLVAGGVWLALVLLVHPSNDRHWAPDQARLATASIDGDQLHIHNLRNAHYRSLDDFDVHWEERSYDLSQLDSVWFVVEPFANWRGPAHTFLSFGFADGRYLAISAEIRREQGESFSPLRGVLRQYELAYVIGDERDLIGLRAIHRKDEVYLYPIQASPVQQRALLLDMLLRANALAQQPEFYNTLLNNCTSNIVDHIQAISPLRIGFSHRTVLPGYSDDLAFDLGLIRTELPRSQYRQAHRIDDLAIRHADHADFSAAIRSRF